MVNGGHIHQKIVNNTYEARLKRLKEELNGPTVTEIIQMHKLQDRHPKIHETGKDHVPSFEETPAHHLPVNSSQPDAAMHLGAQSFDRDR